MKEYTYIEIIDDETGEVEKRIDVSGKSARAIDRVEDGVNRNLNHNDYSTRIKTYKTKQQSNEQR